MKASIEHNDLKGTVAAEMTDLYNHSLQMYMEQNFEGFDSSRYYCRGCQIDLEQGLDTFALRFACFDKKYRKYVLFVTETVPLTELSHLVKKIQLILGAEMQEVFIEEEDMIPLSRK